MDFEGLLPPPQMYIVFAASAAILGSVVTNISKQNGDYADALRPSCDRWIAVVLAIIGLSSAIHLVWIMLMGGKAESVAGAMHLRVHAALVLLTGASLFAWINRITRATSSL